MRECTVCMLLEYQSEYTSEWTAIVSIFERDRLKVLECENCELRKAIEILRKASAYFARAKIDRPLKR